MEAKIIAYFLTIMLVGSPCPTLVGPFTERSACLDVQEWVERRGYETGGCSIMSAPQESVYLDVGYLPR